MTYIVGINMFGRACLISDTCRTTTFRDGRTATELEGSIKTGSLFPRGGCIYALCGRITSATEFIGNVKRHLGQIGCKYSLPAAWDAFFAFTSRYAFPENAPFQLLLSTRHAGAPKFFHLDSQTCQLVERSEEIVTMGSGQGLLDQHVFEIHEQRKNAIGELFKEASPLVYPYLYCLWLMEFIQGSERKTLCRHGVGGFFHHTVQTATMEKRQDPSIYVITSALPSKRVIIPVPFRVLFASPPSTIADGPSGDVLIVQKANKFGCKSPIPGLKDKELQRLARNARGDGRIDTTVFFDSAVWPEVAMLGRVDLEKIAKDIVEKTREPQAYFCGFGFANAGHRASFGVAVSSNPEKVKEEYDFESGGLAPKWQAAIINALATTTAPPGSERKL